MTDTLTVAFHGFAWFAIVYFAILNTWYLCLILLAGPGAVGAARRRPFAGLDKVFRSPLALPISVVVPAWNEEHWIVDCVRGLLDLRYPQFEVIVVDDGSTDATLERLRGEYDLAEIPKVIPAQIPTMGAVLSVHAPRGGEDLLVIRKEGGHGPADAVNTGVNAARYPLVCRVDADSYLDADALLAVVQPFIEDPRRTVGTGASIRVANGAVVRSGRVVTPRMPGAFTAIQAVEYLRAFLLGRTGWAQIQGLLFITGAFGLFRRDIFVEVGGLDQTSDGDDVEFVTRIHHRLRSQKRPYRLGFVPDPCCWTRVPEGYHELSRQRRRWAHILARSLWIHRSMIGNPRYGFMGLIVLPYFLIFELASAVIELAALVMFAAGVALGIVSPGLTVLFIVACIGYATLLSITSLMIEEFSYHRYRTWRDFGIVAFAGIAENVGYRQVHAWWRVRGIVAALRNRRAGWAPRSPAKPSRLPVNLQR
jgi:cellulose synthase/poly-beta-1,6-N-acetylglucosamine synthase-like glycosyltransferase